jgi:methylphosphotriester-DNA--protein-cysteine methyltransferase
MKKTIFFVLILLVCAGTIKAMNTEMLVASSKSNRYHRQSCVYTSKISKKNLLFFKTPDQAIKAGYVPCRVCKPPIINEE